MRVGIIQIEKEVNAEHWEQIKYTHVHLKIENDTIKLRTEPNTFRVIESGWYRLQLYDTVGIHQGCISVAYVAAGSTIQFP